MTTIKRRATLGLAAVGAIFTLSACDGVYWGASYSNYPYDDAFYWNHYYGGGDDIDIDIDVDRPGNPDRPDRPERPPGTRPPSVKPPATTLPAPTRPPSVSPPTHRPSPSRPSGGGGGRRR